MPTSMKTLARRATQAIGASLASLLALSTACAAEVSTLHRLSANLDGLIAASDGSLYVSNAEAGDIYEISPNGTVSTYYNGSNRYFVGLAIREGRLYAAEYRRGEVVRVDGSQLTTIASNVAAAGDLLVDSRDQSLIVASTSPGAVYRINSNGELQLIANVPGVLGLAQDNLGTIYAAGLYDGAVYRIDGDQATRLAQLDIPGQYKIGNLEFAQGYLWATGYGDHRVYRISRAGEVTVVAGSTAGYADGSAAQARFEGPNGIARSPDGTTLLISEYAGRRVRSLSIDAQPAITVNPGLTGFWFNPSIADQGFSLEIFPGNRVGLAWYTYDESGNPQWFTASGDYSDGSAPLTVYRSQGGMLNRASDSSIAPVGAAELRFADCASATFTYQVETASGEISLARLGDGSLCQSLTR